jgi:pyruvate kinase
LVRSLARKAGRAIGVLVDLQGPKIRIGRFKDDKITLRPGEKFMLDADCVSGDQHCVGLDYKNLQ